MDFKGKTVIVTGSSRGIGYSIAEAFAKLNANVMMTGTTDSVFKSCETLKQKGFSIEGFAGDISNADNVQALVNKTVETFGTIDVLVNNAGITRDNLLIRMNEEDWDDVIRINLKGTFLCTKAAVRLMMKKRKGCIINIASIVGLMGNAGQTNYSASKAGIIGFTKSVAREFASRGITCNAIAPGFIETDMTNKLPEEIKENYLKSIPLGRFGTPSDVADLAVFLASDKARYITGQVINVDGGLYM
ncbi:MAG: 3-oxoacyl-[acyl-carrier-protein] reductase [Clostridiaceae bacterium]|nr:3-oxoacyl-[acyl-carrier-protein] reductase [Clostridiaceae bacterium]